MCAAALAILIPGRDGGELSLCSSFLLSFFFFNGRISVFRFLEDIFTDL